MVDGILKFEPGMEVIMQKKLIMAIYDMDDNMITAAFSDGSTERLYVPDLEDALETTIVTRSELDRLLYTDVFEYTQLMLTGGMQCYLDGTSTAHREQKQEIKESLSEAYDETAAEYLSREYMMYDY